MTVMKLCVAAILLSLSALTFAAPPAPATQAAPDGMVLIPAGTFVMGCDDSRTPDAQPLHPVALDAFYMDATPVTNAQFRKFVEATKYVTVAERKPDPKDYPGVPEEKLVAGSAVFNQPPHDVPLDNAYLWWKYEPGASWQHPEGPQSNIDGKDNYPVVHICYDDALAYAKWAGKRLPTEEEWEKAASWDAAAGKKRRWPWGDSADSGRASLGGAARPSDAGQFPSGASAYGVQDMAGNVAEWVDAFYRAYEGGGTNDPNFGTKNRVVRGGSFRSDAEDGRTTRRFFAPPEFSAAEKRERSWLIGFRCAVSADDPKFLERVRAQGR